MSELLPVPKRLGAKIFVESGTSLTATQLIPVFHDWITNKVVDEMLIDVADYSHVLHGPALLLVALEADYVLDEGNGETGIRYIRKRALPATFAAAVTQVIGQAVHAASHIAVEPSLDPPAVFDATRIEIELLDKLNYPSTSVGLEDALTVVIQAIFGDNAALTAVQDDPRRPLRFSVRLDSVDSLRELRDQLDALTVGDDLLSPALPG